MIRVALSTGSIYSYGTARAFELAARAGYDGVEVIVDERWDTRQPEYLRRVAEQSGAPVLSVHSPFAMLSLSGWPRPEVERVKRALDLAEAVGARVLNLHVPQRVRFLTIQLSGRRRRLVPIPGATPDQRAHQDWLVTGGLAALQAKTAVTITVENLPVRKVLGRRVSPYALNTWEALRAFPHLCLDTTHTGTTGADLLDVLRRLSPQVAHVHLSDYDGRYQHQPIGKGYLPLEPFLQALAAAGYDGIVVVELTPEGLPAVSEYKLLAELRRNLEVCRRNLGQAAPETTPETSVGSVATAAGDTTPATAAGPAAATLAGK